MTANWLIGPDPHNDATSTLDILDRRAHAANILGQVKEHRINTRPQGWVLTFLQHTGIAPQAVYIDGEGRLAGCNHERVIGFLDHENSDPAGDECVTFEKFVHDNSLALGGFMVLESPEGIQHTYTVEVLTVGAPDGRSVLS